MTIDPSVAGVFYDADCTFCVTAARRFERVLARRRFELVPLQTPDACARLGVSDDRLLDEMRLRLQNGTVFGGADALAEIARRIWWAWPFWALSRLPGAMRPMRATYRWMARHRSCANGACEVNAPGSLRPLGVLPLLILPVVALLVRSWMPRWAFMWAMAFALYAGCKWLTYCEARARGAASGRRYPLVVSMANIRRMCYVLRRAGQNVRGQFQKRCRGRAFGRRDGRFALRGGCAWSGCASAEWVGRPDCPGHAAGSPGAGTSHHAYRVRCPDPTLVRRRDRQS